METKTSRLSIYMIKEEFKEFKNVIKNDPMIKNHEYETSEKIYYYKDSFPHQPQWIERFFLNDTKLKKLTTSSVQLVLLIKIQVKGNKNQIFAIPFGSGIHLINSESIEERFGLRVVLNSVDQDFLRSIDKKNLSSIVKQAREQVSIQSNISEFGINIEQDLIVGVTGKSNDPYLGVTLTGKDALHVSVKETIDSIDSFLSNCYDKYNMETYKESFHWIDQIQEIKNKAKINNLNNLLVEKINKTDLDKIWLAIPDIIDWEDFDFFSYSFDKTDTTIDDIFIKDFLNKYSENKNSPHSIESLKDSKVFFHSKSLGKSNKNWSIFKCLYSEISEGNDTYIISNGKWYCIENDFVQIVDKEYSDLIKKTNPIILPKSSNDREDEYNKTVSQNSNGEISLLDKKMVNIGGGHSKIEFCDLFTKKNEIIHIKYYGGSSVLSHLFNQSLVSAELMKSSNLFIKLVNEILPANVQLPEISNLNPNNYPIILGIVSYSKKPLNIPFFSKVSLRNVKRRLEMIGYQLYLQKIDFEDGFTHTIKSKKSKSKGQ